MESVWAEKQRAILERVRQVDSANLKLQAWCDALEAEIRLAESESEDAQKQISEYVAAYEKLTSPANRIGLLVRLLEGGKALISSGEGEFVGMIDPNVLGDDRLLPGARLLLNDAYAIVGITDASQTGTLAKVSGVHGTDRLTIGGGPQETGSIILRSHQLVDVTVDVGDEIRLDASGRFAIEIFPSASKKDLFIEDIEPIEYASIGGQEKALQTIRDTLETPLLYPEIFKRFNKKTIKGILLYGPPGCGKTLIGKAVAHNLAQDYSKKLGREVKECFINISGPKILNMWLGESERMVREIFETARKKAKEGHLVVVFIDEAESVLRTRSSGRFLNISNTVVPQFCAEMDGVLGMDNVVVILTSNRPDYIDPAILRPGRIDRKVKIERPNTESARKILEIYLTSETPIAPEILTENDGEIECARKQLVEKSLSLLTAENKETQFLEVALRNGERKIIYFKDVLSGAIIKSIVDRAKDFAIERAINEPEILHGISEEDMKKAIQQEFSENEIFPKDDGVADWVKLIDLEEENVAAITHTRRKQDKDYLRSNML